MSGQPIKVLVISHGHPSFSIGGAEVASYNLFKGIDSTPGWEGHYLARVGPPVTPHRDTGLMSLRQNPRELLLFANDYDHFRMSNRDTDGLRRDFARYLADLKPDVVHFHHFMGLGVETLHEVKRVLPRVPIVATLHEYLSICHHHGQMIKTNKQTLCQRSSPQECAMCFPQIPAGEFLKRELFIKTFFDLVDQFISPSQFLIDRFVDWGLPADRLMMLENGLTLHDIAPARPIPRQGRRNRFGYFGQVTAFKGLHVLLDAIGRVPEAIWGDDSALLVFGGNLENQPEAFREQFKVLMERAGRRARFYGSYRAPEMPTLMREIDWVVVPSIWWENSPLVIQEAFAHGRPVISSNIGGMAEKVRHDVDGLHFRVGSVEDLVDRLCEAIQGRDLWERLRAKARPPITSEQAALQHIAIYQRLLARASGEEAAVPRKARAVSRASARGAPSAA